MASNHTKARRMLVLVLLQSSIWTTMAVASPRDGTKEGRADLTLGYAHDLGIAPTDWVAQQCKVSAGGACGGTAKVLAGLSGDVNADELGNMRGGFALANGVSVSFGFNISTSVAGNLVQSVSLPLTDFTAANMQTQLGTILSSGIANQSFSPAQLLEQGISVTTLENGGLTAVTTSLTNGGVNNLLRNTANNQVIQLNQTFDIGVTGMNANLAQQTTQAMVSRALSASITFHR